MSKIIGILERGPAAVRIARAYAEWTVVSALRSGAPIKSRQHVYGVLKQIPFDELFDHGQGAIKEAEFSEWHTSALRTAIQTVRSMRRELNYGWAAKIVNVYLKTRSYLSCLGRPGLHDCLHPPLDAGLWQGLHRRFDGDPAMLKRLGRAPEAIAHIRSHREYLSAIRICRAAAEHMRCRLIEVEQVWLGAGAGAAPPAHEFKEPPSRGTQVWLWDSACAGEVLGTVQRLENVHLVVSIPGAVVYLQKSAASKLGRWMLTRTANGAVALDGESWYSIEN